MKTLVEMSKNFNVIKRDKSIQDFDIEKISIAVGKAFAEVGGDIHQSPNIIAERVVEKCLDIYKLGEEIDIEAIQNIVEKTLMDFGCHDDAKAYILYRESRRQLREKSLVDYKDYSIFKESRKYFDNDLQMFQYLNKYSRYRYDLGRREAWPETCERVIDFLKWHVDSIENKSLDFVFDWEFLKNSMVTFQAFPSMRMMQMAGPAAKRCNVCIYNCAYDSPSTPKDFADEMYILMQGTGDSFSVETTVVEDLPKIKIQKGLDPEIEIVDDSTEGWCDALLFGMQKWFNGEDVKFDYSKIRPAGEVLKTKGGRASGPGPLRDLLDFVRRIILSRQGKRLRSVDVYDIHCMIGKIVEVGGVRRAAMLSLSDFDDELMRTAKFGEFWLKSPQRILSNNSTVYNEKPDDVEFMEEWVSLAKSGCGERGIFNRYGARKGIPKRRKKTTFGTNPCGEVILRQKEFCNLSIAVIRPTDSVDDIKRKVGTATIFGTIQSTMTNFTYIHEDWKKNCEEERLLGVDLVGASDHKLLQPQKNQNAVERDKQDQMILAEQTEFSRKALLRDLRELIIKTNNLYANKLGICPSVACTVIKPNGNFGVLSNTGNSITGWFARYMKRHVRVNAIDPMAQFLIDSGVPHWPEVGEAQNPRVWVFAFPLEAPKNALLKDDLTAIEQLENWKVFKLYFTEHNPSITIYINRDEWFEVGSWILKNWEIVGGLAFLPKDNGVYQLAPYEAMTEEEYNKFVESFPVISWEKFYRYEQVDSTNISSSECSGNICEI